MVLIRADANPRIGAGHVMRCRSIAGALSERGERAVFVTADHGADGLLAGYEHVCLDTDGRDPDAELPRLLELIREREPSALLLDRYQVTEGYFRALRGAVRTGYMDDLNASVWDVDLLINYNVFSAVFDYSPYRGTGTKLMLGPEYAPLREEFRGMPSRETRPEVRDVLVSAGGADPEGITEKLIRELCPRWPEARFHFVVGSLNPRLASLRGLEGENVILHVDERDMAGRMRACDAAVAAAGTTLYELCAAGVPTVTYSMADNQIPAAREFAARGVMLSAGDGRGNPGFSARVEERLRRLAGDAALRRELSERMRVLVDGNGAARLAEALTTK